jgi:hypothetical protein
MPVPPAAMLNEVLVPAHVVLLVGCVMMDGNAFTVSKTVPEVVGGEHVPVTIQRYWLAVMEIVAAVIFKLAEVAPLYKLELLILLKPVPEFTCH